VETEDFLIKEAIWVLSLYVSETDRQRSRHSVRTKSLKIRVTNGQNCVIFITPMYISSYALKSMRSRSEKICNL